MSIDVTHQGMFDTVALGLLVQGAKSLACPDRPETCAYRGKHGFKCGIGMLIDDEHYTPLLENQTTSSPDVIDALKRSGYIYAQDEVGFLRRLQAIHDSKSPEEWKNSLYFLGKEFGLDTSKIEAFDYKPAGVSHEH